jgi:hypothetical protein
MNAPTTNVIINFTGNTSVDVLAQIRSFAGGEGADLSKLTTEDLLTEVRQRLASQNMVVKVLPFAEEGEGTGGAPAPEPTKQRRTRKASEPQAAPATETAPLTAEQLAAYEAVSTTAAPELVIERAPATTTETASIDDVRSALNAYAAIHGQAKARELMQKKGGALVLMQVPADKYGTLVEALKAGTVEQQAAA